MAEQLPMIDLAALDAGGPDAQHVIQAVHAAASTWGFFLLTGTQVSPRTQSSLVSISRTFFDLPLDVKTTLDVSSGGVAWRGYMPLGGEHTHGRIDWKEGLYIGPEHDENHPLVGQPLHGRNQFPDQDLPDMRRIVLEYVEQVTNLGKTLTDIFSLGLGLGQNHGRYRSRPHRVRRPGPGFPPRFSFPLFFDFAWNAEMVRLQLDHLVPLSEEEKELAKKRWAATTFREVSGRWSQYLARKVQKVFPDLRLPILNRTLRLRRDLRGW